ncbi:MAG: hypothetical protein M1608_04640 [Candidatus Omnitrophica bacterium]|nr:hypothetical protein [Candidatus Omnitrophota bacterium]
MKRLRSLVILILIQCIIACNASAQGTLVREGLEQLLKTLGKTETRELAEFGGERAVKEALLRVEREGGETMVRKTVLYGEKYGVNALNAIRLAPGPFVKCLDELPERLAVKALQAVKREPDLMTRLVSQYGTDALRIAAEHPGVGSQIANTLGREGIDIAEKSTTDTAIRLSRIADPIAKLPAPDKSRLLGALKEAPAEMIRFLEKNPKVLLTSAGVAALIANKDKIFGGSKVFVDKDGVVHLLAEPGFAERFTGQVISAFNTPLSAFFWIAAFLLFAWGVVKIWGTVRAERVRARNKKAQLKSD